MIKVKKLLATLVIMAIICSNFSSIVFAGTTEDQTNTQNDLTALTTDPADTTEDAPTLTEGYFVDEQGEIIYDPTLKVEDETVVDETTDTSEVADDVDVTEDTEDTDAKDLDEKELTEPAYSKSDLRLLSCLIYSESGNQPYNTMLAVANVVINRMDSAAYSHLDSIKEVIYDKKWAVQFAVTVKSKKTGVSPLDKALKIYDSGKYNASMKKSIKAAKAALTGKNNIGSYLCFSNKNYINYVKKHYSKYKIIGDMIFYRSK